MKQFLVVFETRQAGAIGEFSRSAATVEMHQSSFSEFEIYREAIQQFHAKGLETRFPVSVKEVTA